MYNMYMYNTYTILFLSNKNPYPCLLRIGNIISQNSEEKKYSGKDHPALHIRMNTTEGYCLAFSLQNISFFS